MRGSGKPRHLDRQTEGHREMDRQTEERRGSQTEGGEQRRSNQKPPDQGGGLSFPDSLRPAPFPSGLCRRRPAPSPCCGRTSSRIAPHLSPPPPPLLCPWLPPTPPPTFLTRQGFLAPLWPPRSARRQRRGDRVNSRTEVGRAGAGRNNARGAPLSGAIVRCVNREICSLPPEARVGWGGVGWVRG